jgi:hypothetical protein
MQQIGSLILDNKHCAHFFPAIALNRATIERETISFLAKNIVSDTSSEWWRRKKFYTNKPIFPVESSPAEKTHVNCLHAAKLDLLKAWTKRLPRFLF